MAAETKIILQFVKATKGTLVYANTDEGMSNVYFPKTLPVFGGKEDAPKSIEMSLKVVK